MDHKITTLMNKRLQCYTSITQLTYEIFYSLDTKATLVKKEIYKLMRERMIVESFNLEKWYILKRGSAPIYIEKFG